MMEKNKTIPKGTTQEQWDRYYEDLKSHEEHVKRTEPKKEQYGYINNMPPDAQGERAYCNAYSAWDMMRFCDAPNKPNYYRANDD